MTDDTDHEILTAPHMFLGATAEPGVHNESAARKATPLYSGCIAYFPDALNAVARISKKGNDKHNPGQPLHWSRDKSFDHLDCAVRHISTYNQVDPESNEYHLAHAAWRILAQLQLLLEADRDFLKAVKEKP